MISRAELKSRAKLQLGGGIFAANWMMALLICLLSAVICSAAGSIVPGLGALVVIGPMTYGISYIFIKQARDGAEMDIADLFKGFTDDFGGTFLLGLMITIFVALWSILLIVPGIVKSLAYSMAYYIKVDYPELDWRECIRRSSAMMNGHKGELFMLYLSFIGWFIVGSLCLGVGTLWVVPYLEATKVQFYEAIKDEPVVL